MSTSSQRFEELKITVPMLIWTIIITVVLTVLGNVTLYFLPNPYMCNMNVAVLIMAAGAQMFGTPFVMILVIALLMRVPFAKKYLTAGNLALLYIIALSAAAFSGRDSPWGLSYGQFIARIYSEEAVVRYVPEFVFPPREAAEVLIRGAGNIVAIPWGQLLPAMVWRFFLFAFFMGISIGLVSIFRRQWIDVEMLPYPQVAIAYSSIVGVREVSNPKWPGRVTFVLGFLVGLGFELIRALNMFFPWFPDVFLWRVNTCPPGTQWITILGTTWHYGLQKHIPLYALLFLAPLHSLFSIVFWGLVYEVASSIAYYAGYYTGYTELPFNERFGYNTPYLSPPLNFASLLTGVMLGVLVMTIFHERHHIIRTLKMAFGREVDPKLEVEEPMSYRNAWIVFIASFILGIIIFMIAGMSLWASFVVILTGVITWFTTSLLWARVGCSNEPWSLGAPFAKMLLWPTEYYPGGVYHYVTSTDRVLAPWIVFATGSHGPADPWPATLYSVIGSCKMASLMKVHPRNVIKVTSVALIVAIFTACVMNVVLPGVYGTGVTAPNIPSPWAARIQCCTLNVFWSKPSARPVVEITPWVVSGFLFMVVMSSLYARFLWMPDPLMTIIAWDGIGALHGVWSVALIDGIIKWLVLRIGGSKLYEEKAIPFIGGVILGAALNALIAGIGVFIAYPR
jgi:hypothetical protein